MSPTWIEKLKSDPKYVAKAGRVPYLVDFENVTYDGNDCRPVPLASANCWSSFSRLIPEMHLPVFDVDVPRDKIVTDYNGRRTVEEVITDGVLLMCATDVEIRWVPSTTEGHHHVYVEYPVPYGAMIQFLNTLEKLEIVETGYYNAACARLATFVRMPHIKKEPPARMELEPPMLYEQRGAPLNIEPYEPF